MGKLIIPKTADEIKFLPKKISSDFLDMSLISLVNENNEQWVNTSVKIAHNTTAGAEIMAAIKKSDQDIYIILLFSNFIGSQFIPDEYDYPLVILNFGEAHYFPSKNPEPISGTILLFHELGHAAQWITRRKWFEQSSKQSTQNKEDYFVEIEKDNLERYERPICKDLKHPMRFHYDDIFNDDGKAQQRWDKMNTAAITIQRIWRKNHPPKK